MIVVFYDSICFLDLACSFFLCINIFMENPSVIIVMGVSGSGKSFIGKMLAEKWGAVFEDADDFHPPSNIEKMKNHCPLTDEDRLPWLSDLRKRIIAYRKSGIRYVLACSALKESYRSILRGDDDNEIVFVFLHGDKELIRKRMEEREHFMPPALLDSQLATLEVPEYAIQVDIDKNPQEIVDYILDSIEKRNLNAFV
ncbi:gluconokinase [Spirochaetia bacterium 38H-sp]|uniref:Gluconokinase n=1 Tax=Rarispira pelagica TaxID=3141764 RepID=A0ABU9UC22_9SPIR